METSNSFEKILGAFMQSGESRYFFMSEIIIVEMPEVTKESLSHLSEKGFIALPHKSKEFDSKAKEKFVYEITDTKIAEKFFEATTFRNPKKTFDELLKEYNMEETYRLFSRKIYSDALINWLFKNNISLKNPIPVPKVEIISADEKTIPDEMKSLSPITCNKCSGKTFDVFFYKISPSCDNVLIENEARKQLSAKGIENFNFLGETKRELISTAFCKSCKSNDINWDFV